jgi:SAM-dependent methyltransferase
MPAFYNGSIHWLQRLALQPWLRVAPGTTVLEIGCGVGRWSRRLARRGAIVTGIDLSQKMIARARERAAIDRVADRCRFVVADVCALPVGGTFDLVLGVTVLQHILDPTRFQGAVTDLAEHLRPGGRMILLEAAPSRRSSRCDSSVFVAREARAYLEVFRKAGLECLATTGVDPTPLKTWFLPSYRALPKPIALGGLAAITAAGLVPDLVFGRICTAASWHKVFVLQRHDAQSGGAR